MTPDVVTLLTVLLCVEERHVVLISRGPLSQSQSAHVKTLLSFSIPILLSCKAIMTGAPTVNCVNSRIRSQSIALTRG